MVENLNMDFSERVVIETAELDWVPTRMQGVERRMLEREKPESGRATSVVRYAPDSYFSPHTHGGSEGGGEEFVVLEGVFSDEHGDYGPGYYVRNPPGSSHKPFSAEGCTILVKLWQMEPKDDNTVRIDTNFADWLPGQVEGLTVLSLYDRDPEHVALVRWQPGTKFQHHVHPGGEEIFVLEGTFEDEQGKYPEGSWLRNPPYSEHTPFSSEGCLIWVKIGHLAVQDNFS
ncbi:MAG: cupin [Rhodospirillaceae bacterium]|nr:cupin [Rhodospirillaceae bacterium]